MIITETVSSPVLTSIGTVSSKFKIKASAKAFKILSGFYSEPILAIPRELGANAWDSHVKAKNTDKMFEVHAPNTLEPWFSIRDFGTGLTPEAIDKVYTTYFESTKTEENDSDGCMGLGSKTPFNYTENFTVSSWVDGIKYVYNCFIDEAGGPNILPLVQERSNEHNGVEVKFAVKMSDISMFVDKITRAYEPFRFRPTITGAAIVYPERKYMFKNDRNWALRSDTDRYNRRCRAFMGNYSYPVDNNAISALLGKEADYGKLIKIINSGSFDFFFDIGDLEVAPNKEQLQYDGDNRTAYAIISAARTAYSELQELVKKDIGTPKTMWEAMGLYKKYNSYDSPLHDILAVLEKIDIVFDGKPVSSRVEVREVHFKCGLIASSANSYGDYGDDATKKKNQELYSSFRVYKMRNDRAYSCATRMKLSHTGSYELGSSPSTVVFYTKESTIKRARIKEYLSKKHPTSNVDLYLIIDTSPEFKNLNLHKKYFGWTDDTVVNIEVLPKPPVVKRAPQASTVGMVNVANISNNSVYFSKHDRTIEPDKTYYYIDMINFNSEWDGKEISETQINQAVFFAKEHKLIGPTVTELYGINKKDKHLLETGTWINIIDLVAKKIQAEKNPLEQSLYTSSLMSDFAPYQRLYSSILSKTEFLNKIENKKTKKFFEQVGDLYKKMHDNKVVYPDLCSFFKFLPKKHQNLPVTVDEIKDTLDKKYMNIIKLLSDSNYYNPPIETITNFINFVDEKS